jgi:hypothetical protein
MLLMDEFHVSVYAPRGLPEAKYGAMHGALKLARFRRQLRQAALRAYPALRKTRVIVSR